MFGSSDTDEGPNEEVDDEDGGDQIEVETAVPYHDSDSESEPEQLRIVYDFELLSGSDEEESTALDALAFSYVRGPGRGHAVVWDAPEPLGHPSLGSDPHRKGSESQNIILERFLTSLWEYCFF